MWEATTQYQARSDVLQPSPPKRVQPFGKEAGMNPDLHLAAESFPARLGSSASCMDPYRKCNRSARRELQMHLNRMSWPTAFPLGTPWDGVLADACRGAVFRSPDVGAIRQLRAGLSAALVWLKSRGKEVRIDLWS